MNSANARMARRELFVGLELEFVVFGNPVTKSLPRRSQLREQLKARPALSAAIQGF